MPEVLLAPSHSTEKLRQYAFVLGFCLTICLVLFTEYSCILILFCLSIYDCTIVLIRNYRINKKEEKRQKHKKTELTVTGKSIGSAMYDP